MNLQNSQISILYLGPQSSPWVELIKRICTQNNLFEMMQTDSLYHAEISIAARSRATVLLVHGSRYRDYLSRKNSALRSGAALFLAESPEPQEQKSAENWINSETPQDDLEKLIIQAMVCNLEVGKSEQSDAREIVGRAAHDLKSPLAAILGYCKLALSQSHIDHQLRYFFTRIEANVRTADCLIVRQMTDFQAANGKLTVKPEAIRLIQWIQEEFKFEIEGLLEKGLRFEICSARIPDQLIIDGFLLSQIIKNLLENASKNTSVGLIKLTVSYSPSAKRLSVDVTDTGKGISKEKSSEIFEMFSQSDATEGCPRQAHSIGIGLNNAKRLARILGGDVFLVDSIPGQGATFRVEIPAVENKSAMNIPFTKKENLVRGSLRGLSS